MTIRIFTLLTIVSLFYSVQVNAQQPKKPNSAEIQQMLDKMNVLGSALYVAAHPDDENTLMITYLANEKHFRTAYLSATRGDGGQNLIGSEMSEQLGVIRTQELQAARRIDGGQQYFSRANDFGYSKNPEETLEIWNREQVLSDFVRAFRKHRPDIVITRFPEDGGGGHGHHTASAILAGEAFQLASDKNAYPELAEKYGTWQPTRLMFNTHPWFFSREGIPMDSSKYMQVDVGKYNPLLGKSYPEISALSRSMHKSQGFGSTGSRGSQIEFLEFKYGKVPVNDLFEGIDTSWDRIKGGSKVAIHVANAIKKFDPKNPSLIVNDLVLAYKELNNIKDDFWRNIKQEEIRNLIKACTGLYLEIKADQYAYTPGDSIKLSIESINRSAVKIILKSIDVAGIQSFEVNESLSDNKPYKADKTYSISEGMSYSDPYWLKEKGTIGMYKVLNSDLIGTPENKPALVAKVKISVNQIDLDYTIPVVFKENDPTKGELYRQIEITPPVYLNIAEKVYVFGNGQNKQVNIKVIAAKKNSQGQVKLNLPEGWKVTPASFDFDLKLKGEESVYSFTLAPPVKPSEAELMAVATVGGKEYNKSLISIAYDHIPTQTLLPEASAIVVKLDLVKKGEKVGYIKGAGDEIPASLRQIGYQVDELNDEDITAFNLKSYDAVILGVRALNTNDRLKFQNDELLTYTEQGGTVIAQFNTAHALVLNDFGPYTLELSRDRVSVESAEVRMLLPNHPLLNTPNKITNEDFDNWVQERGLYFPGKWDEKYEAVVSSNDPGETPKDGGILVAKYGKGYYIYTGYSWFRQLPAGVPGAYRIFTNMISIGK